MNDYITNKDKVYPALPIVIQTLGLNTIGEIIPIEHSSSLVFGWLDRYCGIDWILKTNDEHVLGIAARIQLTKPYYYNDPQNTFTIRYETVAGGKTEYKKRIESINQGYFYPYYTLHAYVKEEDPKCLLSAAIIKTVDLYDYCRQYSYEVDTNKRDNAFKIIQWRYLQKRNYNMFITGSYIQS
jgi:hypothetical protein